MSQLFPDKEQQSKVAQEFERACQDASLEVHVLVLGQYVDERRDKWEAGMTGDPDCLFGEKWNVGLLLFKPTPFPGVSRPSPDAGGEKWRRLGIIIWDLANGALSGQRVEEKEVLQGGGRVWHMKQGLFG